MDEPRLFKLTFGEWLMLIAVGATFSFIVVVILCQP